MTLERDPVEIVQPSRWAAQLAVLLSPAARIEPELIRAMRLAVLPGADVGVEAELWFSDWIGTRSGEAVTLLPSLLPGLRRQLRTWISEAGDGDRIREVRTVIDHVHAAAPPALRLEEHIAWLSVTGEGTADDALSRAVQAVVREGREGLTDWFAAAWRRLPPEASATVAAWQLVQVAVGRRRLARYFTGVPLPATLTTADAAVVAPVLADVDLAIRRDGSTLTLGGAAEEAVQTIKVPDTRPRLVDVLRTDAGAEPALRSVAVHDGTPVTVDVGTGLLRIRTARGTIYELRPAPGPPAGRLRRGLSRWPLLRRGASVPEELRALLKIHRAAHPDADVTLLLRAYRTAEEVHDGQYRMSGEPYLAHCLAVGALLAELGMDSGTVAAGLLHGSVEHSSCTLDRLRAEFGAALATIVDGVTKLDRMRFGDAARAETIRKLVVAMAAEPRVLVVKLADQVENMRTVSVLSAAEAGHRARETLDILVPLAHRLGMGAVQRELSDLALRTLRPYDFESLHRRAIAAADGNGEFMEALRRRLAGSGIRARVEPMPPHLYAISEDLRRAGRDEDALRAMRVLRVLVDSVTDCYAALGVIHASWQPMAGSFRDTIAVPEFRIYRALHTAVLGPSGGPVELEIRSHAMNRDTEYGVAAMWHVREPGSVPDPMRWMQQLLDWQQETADSVDFLDGLRFELATPQICVFTPDGDPVALPEGSTPVDFAYAARTELGHSCVAARVNGALVPLASTLANGDVVEISTAPGSGPSPSWLGFVTTPHARTKIQHYHEADVSEAVVSEPVHRGRVDTDPPIPPPSDPRDAARLVEVPDAPSAWVKLARCCTPLPGDAIIGFFTRSGGVSVHRQDCADGQELRVAQPSRTAAVVWRSDTRGPAFRALIHVAAFTGHELLAEVTRVVSEEGMAIVWAKVSTSRDRVMVVRMTVEFTDADHLGAMLAAVRGIAGVYDVYRVTSGA